MTTEDQIKDEALQYDINRDVAKISALSSGKIDKYEYLTGEEILPSNQQQITEQAKFTYPPSGKAFEKQTEKQVDAIKYLKRSIDSINELKQIENIFPQNIVKKMMSDKLKEIIDLQNSIKLENLYYNDYDFDKVSLAPIFLGDIYKKISIKDADNEQSNLFKTFGNLNKGRKSSEKITF